jgi:hypothetical protein
MCPICAAKISERRRVELTQAIAHTDLVPALVTFTLQHNQGDKPGLLLGALLDSYRFLKGGRKWANFVSDVGWLGSIRSLEVTYGDNGWHPHLHVLAFFKAGSILDGVADFLKSRWVGILERHERTATLIHGVDFRSANTAVAGYVAKWGLEHELVKSAVKIARGRNGRTPTQLLLDYVDGDEKAGALWQEYARAFKGKRQLVWSRGLRDLLGLGKEETDEGIVQREEEAAVLLAQLTLKQWRVVLAHNARGELLEVANSGEAGAVLAFVDYLGQQRR